MFSSSTKEREARIRIKKLRLHLAQFSKPNSENEDEEIARGK